MLFLFLLLNSIKGFRFFLEDNNDFGKCWHFKNGYAVLDIVYSDTFIAKIDFKKETKKKISNCIYQNDY